MKKPLAVIICFALLLLLFIPSVGARETVGDSSNKTRGDPPDLATVVDELSWDLADNLGYAARLLTAVVGTLPEYENYSEVDFALDMRPEIKAILASELLPILENQLEIHCRIFGKWPENGDKYCALLKPAQEYLVYRLWSLLWKYAPPP